MPTYKYITHTQAMHTVLTNIMELLYHGTKNPLTQMTPIPGAPAFFRSNTDVEQKMHLTFGLTFAVLFLSTLFDCIFAMLLRCFVCDQLLCTFLSIIYCSYFRLETLLHGRLLSSAPYAWRFWMFPSAVVWPMKLWGWLLTVAHRWELSSYLGVPRYADMHISYQVLVVNI